jgi:hypothetical protein
MTSEAIQNNVAVLLIAAIGLFSQASQCATPANSPPVTQAPTIAGYPPRYVQFKTGNMWNFFLLDSRTGRLWQVQFTVSDSGNRIIVPINKEVLAPDGFDGRFTLTLTENMWTGLLLDAKTGHVWQCQFSLEPQNRGCIAIPLSSDAV